MHQCVSIKFLYFLSTSFIFLKESVLALSYLHFKSKSDNIIDWCPHRHNHFVVSYAFRDKDSEVIQEVKFIMFPFLAYHILGTLGSPNRIAYIITSSWNLKNKSYGSYIILHCPTDFFFFLPNMRHICSTNRLVKTIKIWEQIC